MSRVLRLTLEADALAGRVGIIDGGRLVAVSGGQAQTVAVSEASSVSIRI